MNSSFSTSRQKLKNGENGGQVTYRQKANLGNMMTQLKMTSPIYFICQGDLLAKISTS